MAPEQALAKSNEMDGQTDVWAAGATLFTLLSGDLVHEGDNAPQVVVKAATTQARSVATVAPNTPAAVTQIIDRALAFDKKARWPSAEAMRDAIRDTYLALYGEAISRAPLATLLSALHEPAAQVDRGKVEVALSPTVDLSTLAAPAPNPTASAPVAAASGGTLVAGAIPFSPITTSEPVSSDAPGHREGTSRKRGSRVIIGTFAIATVAILAFATFKLAGPSARSGATTPSLAASIAAVTNESPASPSAAPSTAMAIASTPATASSPPSAAPSAIATASATTVHASRPAARPCKLVKTLDKAGESHFSCPCGSCQ
jgi:eukaryotic-like serine/threonine-protein kinase